MVCASGISTDSLYSILCSSQFGICSLLCNDSDCRFEQYEVLDSIAGDRGLKYVEFTKEFGSLECHQIRLCYQRGTWLQRRRLACPRCNQKVNEAGGLCTCTSLSSAVLLCPTDSARPSRKRHSSNLYNEALRRFDTVLTQSMHSSRMKRRP